MSSEHIIIVAWNPDTGEVRLPLGELMLYGAGGEQELLEKCRRQFSDEWLLSLYRPTGDWLRGSGRSTNDHGNLS